jgi:very-short-patch-repair endonuclease/DNA-directed RNA polymerase subunit RPC12/RpoP
MKCDKSVTKVITKSARQWKYDEVKRYIGDRGYVLMSKEYKNNATHLDMRCNRGHQYKVTFNTFQQGHRCPYCSGRIVTYNHVRQYIESQGYVLISKQYKGSQDRLLVQCGKGHQYKVTWNNFQQGVRCAECCRTTTYRQVKSYITKAGYRLLGDVFTESKNEINLSKNKISLACPKGHQYKTSWSCFQQGSRCPYCARKKVSYQIVQEYIQSQGYDLLSTTYETTYSDLIVQCDKKHIYKVSWTNFQQGQRCPVCAGKRTDLKQVKDYVEQQGYTLLSQKYAGAHTRLQVSCPKKHQYQVTWNNFQQGHRCPYCLNKSEHKLGQILEELFPNKIKKQGNLGFLGRQRVDYYIEEEKIAIEYDGIQHYHPLPGAFGAKTEKEAQKQLRETQKRDKRKEQLCKENGWRLIRIRYDEPLSAKSVGDKVGYHIFLTEIVSRVDKGVNV